MNVQLTKIAEDENQDFIARKTQVDNYTKLILSLVRRNWPLILLFTILGTAIGWFAQKEVPYTGQFEMLLEPASANQQISDATVLLSGPNAKDAIDYPTQLEILKSPIMLTSIAERLSTEFPGSSLDIILLNLQRNLEIERVQAGISRFDQTKIISVTYEGRSPREVNKVLEVTADKFLEYSIAERQNSIQSAVSFIDNQLPTIQSKIADIQAQQQNMQKKYQLITPDQKGQELFLQNNQIEAEIREVQSGMAEANKVLSNLSNQLGLTVEEVLLVKQLSKNDQFQSELLSLQELQQQLREIENSITVQSARFNQDSPMLATLEDRKSYLQNLIDEKKQSILTTYNLGINSDSNIFAVQDENSNNLMKEMLDTQNQVDILESRYQSLLKTQEKIQNELLQITQVIKEYSELQRQLVLTSNTLNQLTLEREKLSVVAAQQDRPWELISPPEIISHRVDGTPNVSGVSEKRVAAGLLGGLLLGLLIASALERMKNTYNKEKELLWSFSNIPVLGGIPLPDTNIQTEDKNGQQNNSDLLSNPEVSQATLALYTEIYFRYKHRSINSLVLCSVEPGDGQGFVCANLAKVIADSGKKVLVVDTNFSEPAMHKYFSVSNEKGLRELLAYSLKPDSIIQPTKVSDNLSVLTAGNKLELNNVNLSSDKVKELADLLKPQYDLVIYNAPLFLESSDVSFLVNKTDGMLMVVRLKKTSHSLVKKAFEIINSFDLPMLGFVTTN